VTDSTVVRDTLYHLTNMAIGSEFCERGRAPQTAAARLTDARCIGPLRRKDTREYLLQ
jgi:hypothetical protein